MQRFALRDGETESESQEIRNQKRTGGWCHDNLLE
jgi:hypothetical protein